MLLVVKVVVTASSFSRERKIGECVFEYFVPKLIAMITCSQVVFIIGDFALESLVYFLTV